MTAVNVRIVERDGTPVADFEAGGGDSREVATVHRVTRELNAPRTADLTIPAFHPSAAQLLIPKREIQIFRGDDLVFWGPAVEASISGGAMRVHCEDPLWYLTRSHFGPITTNYLTNPNFETDLSGWTATGTTATHKTDVLRFDGPGTVELVETDGGQDSYLEQSFTVDTGEIGLYIEVRAMCWIDPTSDFEPAFEERGLAVGAINSVQTSAWRPINNHTPRGWPQMLVTGINLLPNLTDEQVTVLLYSPKGTIRWGACVATIQESVSTDTEGSDVTEMMRRIVAYANTKGGFELATSTPASGVGEFVAYQFMDLAQVYRVLRTYPERGLADFSIEITETTKTFTTHAPTKGADLTGTVTLTVPSTGTIRLDRYLIDARQTATQVIRRGPGSGASRALGVATDTGPLDGMLLMSVADAPPEITIDGLGQYATAELARQAEVVQIPDVTVPAALVFDTPIVEGDLVGVDLDWGVVQDTTARRVLRLDWDPEHDTVKVGLTR